MRSITATELARQLKKILDRVEFAREEFVVTRNNQPIARLVGGTASMSAIEVMADLHRTLENDAGANWVEDSRGASQTLSKNLSDPWDS